MGYGYRKIGFILDRGYFSKANLDYMDHCGYDFVVMVKGMSTLVNELILENKGKFEDKRACSIRRHMVYGTTVKRKLFLTDDPDEAQLLAAQIHSLNNDRKKTEQEITDEILDVIRQHPETLSERVLVFAGENWHHGVIGIVAARLMERFGKPCFLMSLEEDGYRGSARSFGDFSVFECLKACEAHLARYGGHPGAGGFTVLPENKDAFMQGIRTYAAAHNPVMPVMTVHAERAMEPQALTPENVAGLQIMEPFGAGNPNPLFVLPGMTVTEVVPLSGGAHTKLRLRKGPAQCEVLLFRLKPEETGIRSGEVLDFLIAADVKEYQGRPSLTLRAEDWRSSAKDQEQAIAAQSAYDAYRRGEPLPAPAYYQRMCPHRQDLIAVYQLVQRMPLTVSQICRLMQSKGMNRCRARMIADIFSELNLLRYDPVTETLSKLPVTQKRELNESEAYRKILAHARENASRSNISLTHLRRPCSPAIPPPSVSRTVPCPMI